MYNYYLTHIELKSIESRIELLKERKQRLFSKITSCTAEMNDEPSRSNEIKDKMANYVLAVEKIDEELKELEADYKVEKKYYDKMQNKINEIDVNNTSDIRGQVLKLRFVENKKLKDIAKEIPCSMRTVSYYIKKIKLDMNM